MSWELLTLLNVSYEWQYTPETTRKFFRLTWQPAIGYDVSGRALIGQCWLNQNNPELFGVRSAFAKDEGDLYFLEQPFAYPQSRRIAFRFLPANYWSRLNSVLIEQWTGPDTPPSATNNTTNNTFNVNVGAPPVDNRPGGQVTTSVGQSVPTTQNTKLTTFAAVEGYGGVTGDPLNPGRIILPEAGLWCVGFQCIFAANSTGTRAAWLRRNDSIDNPYEERSAVSSRYLYPTNTIVVGAGNFLEMWVYHTAGVNLSVSARFYAFKVS